MDWYIFNTKLKNLMTEGKLLCNEEELIIFINHPEATIEALEAFKLVLEEDENYEWCIIVKNKIDSLYVKL